MQTKKQSLDFRRASSLGLALVLSLSFNGCGGGSSQGAVAGTGANPATVQINADTVLSNWNEAKTIDALANDTVSSGKLSLVSVTGAAHGKTVLDGNKIIYTPDAGFFGTEKLSYSAKAEVGGASASTDVNLTVQAQLTLKGNASDAPLVNATVTATVNGNIVTSTTDAQGNYALKLASDNPQSFVSITAVGSATQAKVKLTSYVGDLANLAKLADAGGNLSTAVVPTLAVSHISTAQQVLIDRALGGKAPSTSEGLRLATQQVNINDVIQLSTAIRLVADLGVALPSEVSDTLALIQNPTVVTALYASLKSSQPELLDTAKNTVLHDLPAASDFSLNGMAERTVNYKDGRGAMTVTYKADGTGYNNSRGYQGAITWTAAGATVQITYGEPLKFTYAPGDIQVAGVSTLNTIEEITVGMRLTQIFGNTGAGSVRYSEFGSVKWSDGPNAGQDVVGANLTTNGTYILLADNLSNDQALPLSPTLFAVGNKFTGCIDSCFDSRVDSLEITSGTEAKTASGNSTVTWALAENKLNLTFADGTKERYSLLWNNTSTGEQRWSAENLSSHNVWQRSTILNDSPAPKITEALALRNTWMVYKLNADKTTNSIYYRWEITTEGNLIITRSSSAGVKLSYRTFSPIKTVGNVWWFVQTNTALPGNTISSTSLMSITDQQ